MLLSTEVLFVMLLAVMKLSNFQLKAIGATLERCDNIAHNVKSQIAPAALSLLLHFTLTCKKQMELCRLEVMAAHSCSRNSSNCTFPTKFLFCIFCCMFLEKGHFLYNTEVNMALIGVASKNRTALSLKDDCCQKVPELDRWGLLTKT